MEASLKLNMFFLRILKEHSLFIAAALPPVNASLIDEGGKINRHFCQLLSRAVKIATGRVDIGPDAVTPYTLKAEQKTATLTGFPINTELTAAESELSKRQAADTVDLSDDVRRLNTDAVAATKYIIRYKTKVLSEVSACRIFSFNYPLLLEHTRREALEYLNEIENLQKGTPDQAEPNYPSIIAFWNHIMQEHAEFIRGMLDPSERELFALADQFRERFEKLLKRIPTGPNEEKLIIESRKETNDFKNFNQQGAEGLLQCSIKAVILPLLADHLIREANHYLLLLDKKL